MCWLLVDGCRMLCVVSCLGVCCLAVRCSLFVVCCLLCVLVSLWLVLCVLCCWLLSVVSCLLFAGGCVCRCCVRCGVVCCLLFVVRRVLLFVGCCVLFVGLVVVMFGACCLLIVFRCA